MDELTTAPPSVQAALLRVILERKVGFRALPKGVRVVAAANPPDVVTGGWELSPPLRNRFVHIRWELLGQDYLQALTDGFARPELPAIDPDAHREASSYWQMIVAAFLRRSPDLARTPPSDEEHAFASPRTWDYAIALLASCDLLGKAPKPGQEGEEVCLRLVEGCIGRGVATAFAQFLLQLRVPDPDEVLDGKVSVNVARLRDDELYVLFSTMAAGLVRRQQQDGFVDAMLTFLKLAERVAVDGKTDAIFVPLRQVARGQLLTHAVLKAQQRGKSEELQRVARRTFEETPLKKFVSVLVPRAS